MDVTIRCVCPPKADGAQRHEQDTITLADILDFRRTLTVRQEIRFASAERQGGDPMSLAEMTALMAEAYIVQGITGWSLVDEAGKAVPPTRTNIRAFLTDHYEEAERVGDAADTLYTDKVVLPLLNRASTSSPPTPTPGSTSANEDGDSPTNGASTATSGQTKPRKPLKPSSTSTSPMIVTGPMAASPGGGSSFSQS